MRYSATSSGELNSTSQVSTQPGYLHNIELNPPAIGLATLKIYDSNAASASSLLLLTATVAAGQNAVNISYTAPRSVNKGVYAVLTGTTTYAVGYSLG